jgi:hypothetical protein
MATNLKFSTTLKNAMENAITSAVGASCIITFYNGTQPASPDTAITSQTALTTGITGNATFAPAASGGILTLNAITSGVGSAGASTGTVATWFRITTSGGTAVIDGTAGTSGADLNFTGSASIATGQTVSISSFTLTNGN